MSGISPQAATARKEIPSTHRRLLELTSESTHSPTRPDFNKRKIAYDSGNSPSNKSGGCNAGNPHIECRNRVAWDGREINRLPDLDVGDDPNLGHPSPGGFKGRARLFAATNQITTTQANAINRHK